MKKENKDFFELMLASNDDEEQFPVLKAFQSYIEVEREKSRRRQSQITICFLVSTILLVICFCIVGFAFFSKFIEKDNQLTQLLLLERAGIKPVPQEVVVSANNPSTEDNSQAAELAGILAELKKERAALEQLKADISKQQQAIEVPAAPENVKNEDKSVNKPEVSVAPSQPSKDVVKQEKNNAPVVAPTTSTTSTTTSTTSTTSTTTTTTTLPPAVEKIEVQMPERVIENSVIPDGYVDDSIKVKTDNNVSVPWHILLPNAK